MSAALSAPAVRAAAFPGLGAAAHRTSRRHATNLSGSNHLRVPGASLPALAPARARRGSVALRRSAVVDSDAADAAEAGTAATVEMTVDASSSADADADDDDDGPEVPDSKLT